MVQGCFCCCWGGRWFLQRCSGVRIRDKMRHLPCELQEFRVRIADHIKAWYLDEIIHENLHIICTADFTRQNTALEGACLPRVVVAVAKSSPAAVLQPGCPGIGSTL